MEDWRYNLKGLLPLELLRSARTMDKCTNCYSLLINRVGWLGTGKRELRFLSGKSIDRSPTEATEADRLQSLVARCCLWENFLNLSTLQLCVFVTTAWSAEPHVKSLQLPDSCSDASVFFVIP